MEMPLTQNETIWLLVGIIQFGVMGFVSYWTRRVQRLEETISQSMEERTRLMMQYQGRVSTLEAQFDQIMSILEEIREELKDSRNRGRKGEK